MMASQSGRVTIGADVSTPCSTDFQWETGGRAEGRPTCRMTLDTRSADRIGDSVKVIHDPATRSRAKSIIEFKYLINFRSFDLRWFVCTEKMMIVNRLNLVEDAKNYVWFNEKFVYVE